MVIWRYMVVGDPIVKCVVIRKIDKKTEPFSDYGGNSGKKTKI